MPVLTSSKLLTLGIAQASLALLSLNRNQGLLVKVAKPRLKVKIINGLNEIERNFRLRDFMVRCTLGPCPLISSLRKKTNEFALFQR